MQIYPYIRYAQILIVKERFALSKAYDCRFFYCLDGQGEMVVERSSYRISKGTLLLWQPGMLYSLTPNEKNIMKLIGFNFDFTCRNMDKNVPIPPSNANHFKKGDIIESFDDAFFNKVIYLNGMEYIEASLLEIRREYVEMKNFYEMKMTGLFLTLLAEIKRVARTTHPTAKENCLINNLIAYISSHYNEDLSNKRIGEIFNYHPNYINRLMRQHTGISLHRYVLSYRISIAIKFIQTTDLSMSEISIETGFHDFSHFSKCFKKMIGRNPTDFRHSEDCLLI